jgi:transposase
MKKDTAPAASVGLDIAKTWFQVHGADDEGKPVFRHKLGVTSRFVRQTMI